MKNILRSFLVYTITLALISSLIPQVSYHNQLITLLTASLVLTLLHILVRPIIKLLLLPLNLITLGLFGWVANVIIVYLTTFLVPQFTISAFTLPSLTVAGIHLPAIVLSRFWAIVVISFLINITTTIITSVF